MNNPLLEPWHTAAEMTLRLLDAVPESSLHESYASRTRSIAEQFAHLHNVRLMWMEVSAPKLYDKKLKIGKDEILTKALLSERLKQSAEQISELLNIAGEKGKVSGFKKSPLSFLGYLISHEAHHRGLVMVSLRLSGHKLPAEFSYSLWDWGK